jgi:maltoporin
MRAIFLTLLLLPIAAFATSSEIEELRRELAEMRAQNARYEQRLNELEARLESGGVKSSGSATSLNREVTEEAILPAVEVDGVSDFSTDFDPKLFDYYGYMRAGYGIGKGGESQERFKLPGADAAYRLGNETDTYMEAGFSYYKVAERKDRPSTLFGTHFLLAFSTLDKATGIPLDGDNGTVSLREVFATAQGSMANQPDARLWAGQRFYRRHDIHINDFFWLDMSGFGGGLEDYDLGFAKGSVAWIGGTLDDFTGTNDYIGDLDTTDKNNIDLRLNDIDIGIGRGNFWFVYSHYQLEGEFSGGEELKGSADGIAAGFFLVSAFGESNKNTAVIQYGNSVAANFNSFSPSLRTSESGEIPEGTSVEDQSRLRLMNILEYNFNQRLGLQAVAIYQHDDLGLVEDSDRHWYSIGVRPVYSLSQNYNLAFEAGYDYSKLESGEQGGLLKLTVAPEITPDWGLFSRPAIRLYLTWAKWSDEFRGLIGGTTYADDTNGFSLGVQFESWW